MANYNSNTPHKQSADSCLTQTGNVNFRLLLGCECSPFPPLTSCVFFSCSFTCSVLPAIRFASPSYTLLRNGMCVSAVFDESVVNGALPCLGFHVTCSLPEEGWIREVLKAGGRGTGRHIPIAEVTNANSWWLRKTGLSQFWTAAGWITTQHVHAPGLIKSCKNKADEVNIRTV